MLRFVVAETSDEYFGGWPGLGGVWAPWLGGDGCVAHHAQIDDVVLLARWWGAKVAVHGLFPEHAHQPMDFVYVYARVGRDQRLARRQRFSCIFSPGRSRGRRPRGKSLEIEQIVSGVVRVSERSGRTRHVFYEAHHDRVEEANGTCVDMIVVLPQVDTAKQLVVCWVQRYDLL